MSACKFAFQRGHDANADKHHTVTKAAQSGTDREAEHVTRNARGTESPESRQPPERRRSDHTKAASPRRMIGDKLPGSLCRAHSSHHRVSFISTRRLLAVTLACSGRFPHPELWKCAGWTADDPN